MLFSRHDGCIGIDLAKCNAGHSFRKAYELVEKVTSTVQMVDRQVIGEDSSSRLVTGNDSSSSNLGRRLY